MFECGTCDKVFPSGWRAREQHCNSTGHSPPEFECDTCDAFFRSDSARWQHMRAKGHFSQADNYSTASSASYCSPYMEFGCRFCLSRFDFESDKREHEVENHYYCGDCERGFNNLNNIKQHLNSRTHRADSISCPFCAGTFTTATGMTHHLERGACPRAPSLNRDQIYNFVRSKDPSGLISKPLIGWHGSSATTYMASDRAWNGSGYECYLCHRQFRSLAALNQHLASDTHREALYHCPKRSCGTEFKTLAAVINHLESESCGAMRFEAVQHGINDFVSGNRLLQF